MVLDHDPFLGGFDHMAFTALIPVVVAVDACVERVGEHGANGSGVPRFPGPGANALLVEGFGYGSKGADSLVLVIDVGDDFGLWLIDAKDLVVLIVGITWLTSRGLKKRWTLR